MNILQLRAIILKYSPGTNWKQQRKQLIHDEVKPDIISTIKIILIWSITNAENIAELVSFKECFIEGELVLFSKKIIFDCCFLDVGMFLAQCWTTF